jgi:F-type H+-transporting ATPase subunit epsilon
MAESNHLTIRIISPDRVIFEGTGQYLEFPSPKGVTGVMTGHTPMFAAISRGDIVIHNDPIEVFPVKDGLIKIRDNQAILLVTEK